MRIRLYTGAMTKQEEEILRYVFSSIDGVEEITVYAATAGCAFVYSCDRRVLIDKLDRFQYRNVEMLAKEAQAHISAEEMRARKLDPALKRRLRARIVVETAADMLLPMPLQIGYHAYQLITLRDI